MDELDRRILQAVQDGFPLSEKPYETMAHRLGIPSDRLWDRLRKLMAQGVIRRLGASLDSRKLGFCSTLAAVSVKPDLVEQTVEIIGEFPEVTHSYLRNDDFNIWFTIIASDTERIESILEQTRASLSLERSEVLNLPMKRVFKLDARFSVTPRC